MNTKTDDHLTEEHDTVSKSQRKREMHAIRDLGKELTETSPGLLEKLALPPGVEAAIAEYKRLPNSHAAKKRQLQFIGKLLRDVDTEQVIHTLDQSRQGVARQIKLFHDLEALRDQLLAGNDEALQQLISEQPELDIQHVRQLIRQAEKEAAQGKPPAAGRKLFKYLRQLLLA